MSTNAYEEMLEYLDGQRKKLADMRERLDEPGVEKQYEACLKAYRDLKNSLDWAKEKGFAEGYMETRLKILMLEYGKTREEALVKRISIICAAVTICGVLGKCLRLPVTRNESSLLSVTS